jgi:hypothetical protein
MIPCVKLYKYQPRQLRWKAENWIKGLRLRLLLLEFAKHFLEKLVRLIINLAGSLGLLYSQAYHYHPQP